MRGEFVEVGSDRFYYYAAGTRQSGETLLFLHGLLTSGHVWGEVIPLVPRLHRSVVVDLPGHGRSDPGAVGPLNVADHAGRITAFMRCLGIERATLVGHGFGADVAMRTAQDSPARVRRLALISPLCETRLPWTALYRLARWRRLASHLPPVALRYLARRALLSGYSSMGQVQPVHSVGLYLRPYASRARVTAMLGQIAAVDGDGGGAAASVPSDLEVAIAWGDEDPFVSPEVVERLHSTIARSTLDRIGGGGHFLPEEVPERVASFLSALLER